jgi:hypothetical protein
MKPPVKNIECLPDSNLIHIFKSLDIDSLNESSKVCQRWNYLCNTDELWIFKCRQIGREENLNEIERIIFDEQRQNEDIDWKSAYIELKSFINKLKLDLLQTVRQKPYDKSRSLSRIFDVLLIPYNEI